MASFKSVLEHVGSIALKILHIGETAAIIAQPIINQQFGAGIGAVVSSTVNDVLTAEQVAKAAGMQSAGPQKAAAVVQSLAQSLPALEKDFGITVPKDKQDAYVQAVYNLTQLFAPLATATVAPVSVAGPEVN